jgi:hypothetical protein
MVYTKFLGVGNREWGMRNRDGHRRQEAEVPLILNFEF